jgi:hypothetical protein
MDTLHQRLQHQQISKPLFEQPDELVKWFGAMQAQDYAAAKWAIALRLKKDITDAEIEDSLTAGKILRTHVLRPTWHFVHPADIRWMLELTKDRVRKTMLPYERQLSLDAKVYSKCNKIIVKALEGGNSLTRPELMVHLEKADINTDETRSAFIAMNAELDGLICSGPKRTYMLLDERVPAQPAIDRDEALSRLAATYFQSHGPATPHDFAWRSGLTLTDAKRGMADLKLAPVTAVRTRRVFLLPNFDEYSVAYADRKSLQGDNILFKNIIVENGVVQGTWKRTIKKDTVIIEPTLFKPLNITPAAKSFAKFLGLKLLMNS